MTSDRQRVRSGWAARLGLFAILFQAILFGWHHHDLALAGNLPAPVIENSTTQPQALDDEDSCEICSVLHHLTAAPVDLLAVPPPPPIAVALISGAATVIAQTLALAFRARAPPLT